MSAAADAAPTSADAFLVLDEDLFVGAVSKRAQLLLGASANATVDRHIDEFLTLPDAQSQGGESLEEALARLCADEITRRDLAVDLRADNGDTIRFRARTGRCGPPPATLIVLSNITD